MLASCLYSLRYATPIPVCGSRPPNSLSAISLKYLSTQTPRRHLLSIDGGGIRGIIPGRILQHIEEQTKQPIAHLFDMIAGTSTGGILSVGVSVPKKIGSQQPKYKASEVLDFYLKKEFTSRIFQKPPTQDDALDNQLRQSSSASPFDSPSLPLVTFDIDAERTAIKLLGKTLLSINRTNQSVHYHSELESLRKWIEPRFTSQGIEEVLKENFGSCRLKDLIPNEVLVPSFNTTTMEHHLFSKQSVSDNPLVWKVARATSAAPTYFPPFVIKRQEHVDGGVYANNPALALLLQARRLHGISTNIFCLSLGTGHYVRSVAPTTHDGPLQWAGKIFDAASAGDASLTHQHMQSVLNSQHYVRFQAQLKENIELDRTDDEAIEKLIRAADQTVEENRKILDHVCQILTTRRPIT